MEYKCKRNIMSNVEGLSRNNIKNTFIAAVITAGNVRTVEQTNT